MTVSISFPSSSSSAIDLSNYQLKSEKGSIDGYASLDSTGKLVFTEIPTGTTANTVAEGDKVIAKDSGTFTNTLTGTKDSVDNQPVYINYEKSRAGGNVVANDLVSHQIDKAVLNGSLKNSGVIAHRVLDVGAGAEKSQYFLQNLINGTLTTTLNISDKLLFLGVDLTPEVGIFTPIIRTLADSTEPTYSTQTGNYFRIGKRIFFNLLVICSSTISTGSGILVLHGLPFSAISGWSSYQNITVGYINSLVGVTGQVIGFVESGSTRIRFYSISNGNAANSSHTWIQNNSNIRISGSYQIA